jgi:hypothetical protein
MPRAEQDDDDGGREKNQRSCLFAFDAAQRLVPVTRLSVIYRGSFEQ